MARADAQVGRGDGHRIRRLAKVVLEQSRLAIVLRLWRDDRDRGRRTGDMLGALPDLRQFDQLRPVRDEHEVPRLPVARRRGTSAGLENSVERLVRDWLLSELPNVSSRPQGVPGFHGVILRLPRRCGDHLPCRLSPSGLRHERASCCRSLCSGTPARAASWPTFATTWSSTATATAGRPGSAGRSARPTPPPTPPDAPRPVCVPHRVGATGPPAPGAGSSSSAPGPVGPYRQPPGQPPPRRPRLPDRTPGLGLQPHPALAFSQRRNNDRGPCRRPSLGGW